MIEEVTKTQQTGNYESLLINLGFHHENQLVNEKKAFILEKDDLQITIDFNEIVISIYSQEK